MDMYTLLYFKWIANRTYCIAQGTWLNVMWQLGWEGSLGGEWIPVGIPKWLSGEESGCHADVGSIPEPGRSPVEGNGNPLQYSCLGNLTDRRAWWAIVHGIVKELDTT